MSFRFWTAVAVCLFAVGMLLGFTLRGTTAELLAGDIAALQQLAAALGPFKVSTAIFILVKNVSTLVIGFILSPLLCIMPVLALTLNGWLLSYVGMLAAEQKSVGFVLAAILPHGIFEIPALIIGEAAALSFGVAVMAAVVFKKKRPELLPSLKRSLRFLLIAAVLLVPAAVIETYITPLLAR